MKKARKESPPTHTALTAISSSNSQNADSWTTSEIPPTISPKPISKTKNLPKRNYTKLDLSSPSITIPGTSSLASASSPPPLAIITQYDESSSPPSSSLSCIGELNLPKPSEDTLENFPSLPPTPSRAPTPRLKSRNLFSLILGPNKVKAGRVLRILPQQKSSSPPPQQQQEPNDNDPIPTSSIIDQ